MVKVRECVNESTVCAVHHFVFEVKGVLHAKSECSGDALDS